MKWLTKDGDLTNDAFGVLLLGFTLLFAAGMILPGLYVLYGR